MLDQRQTAGNRFAGVTLATAAVLSILAMSHHPSSPGTGLGQLVHGFMLAAVLATSAGFIRFAASCGLQRFSVQMGLTCYGAGAIANVFAALINGFVLEALHARGAEQGLLRLCWELNQALAYFGVYAISAAFATWGIGLLIGADQAARPLGIAALAAGLIPAALLASGVADMHVGGAFAVYAIQSVFAVIAGAALMRKRAGEA